MNSPSELASARGNEHANSYFNTVGLMASDGY
jgi:hypothetical protein